MTVTRREAVRLGAVSAVTAAATATGFVPGAGAAEAASGPGARARAAGGQGSAGAAAPDGRAGGPDAAYRLAFWRGLVGSRISLADRSGVFLVVRVQDMTSSKAAAAPSLPPRRVTRSARTGDAFAVRLRAMAPGMPGDRAVRLTHPAVGRFDLFITGADPGSQDFVAVVNRRLPVG